MSKLMEYRTILFLIVAFKLILLVTFSSDYQDQLFIPFINYFTDNIVNPWEYFSSNNLPKSFPYPPLMLYILSICYKTSTFLGGNSLLLIRNLFFKLPTLFADLLIFWLLSKLFPSRLKEVTLFYFVSPIILYGVYVHSQLDLIPTSLLLLALYLLVKDKILLSSIIFGLAISTKFHVFAALPLILIYLYKNKKRTLYYIFVPLLVYLIIASPYLISQGYIDLVLFNTEQNQIFDVYFNFNNIKIYMAPLMLLLIYARFIGYAKINNDLLFSSLGLLFSVFILFVPPMPAWYVWVIPFVSIYFIHNYSLNSKTILTLNFLISFTYLTYFLFFHISKISDVNFIGIPLNIKLDSSPKYSNLSFTFLEATLLSVIYFLYKYGIKSNSVYKKKSAAFIIGIGGDSGSGKSTLLADVKDLLSSKTVLHVEGDGDHKWERGDDKWNEYTHLNPKANHLHRQSDDLIALKRGETIRRVEYDHDTGRFTDPQKIKSNDYIVMGGLHPFYLPKMRKIIDLKIYLETDEDLRRHWKVLRDTKKRGYSIEKVIEQIESRMPDAQKYIWPQKQFADIIISHYSDSNIMIGNELCNPEVKLKITVDSSVDLEPLLVNLEKIGLKMEHDYAEDLQTQFLIVEQDMKEVNFELLADKLIQNKDEILLGESKWFPNYRGLIQLIILIMISEKMKEYVEHEV